MCGWADLPLALVELVLRKDPRDWAVFWLFNLLRLLWQAEAFGNMWSAIKGLLGLTPTKLGFKPGPASIEVLSGDIKLIYFEWFIIQIIIGSPPSRGIPFGLTLVSS